MISLGEAAFPLRNVFFRRDALKEQFGKEPSTVRCLAVKSALLRTRHPREEKEAALQNVTGEPACLYCKMLMTTQSEVEPSIKIEEMKFSKQFVSKNQQFSRNFKITSKQTFCKFCRSAKSCQISQIFSYIIW